jgi:hypothetical protein
LFVLLYAFLFLILALGFVLRITDIPVDLSHQALRIFREHRIRSVDAVILTHGHADAIAGLGSSSFDLWFSLTNPQILIIPSCSLSDDLRAFNVPLTPNGPKPPPLPIYLSAQTLNAISAQYPYLVDKNKATGGGDVPSLDWRVWGDEWEDEEVSEGREMSEEVREGGFVVCGLKVLPLKGEWRVALPSIWMREMADRSGNVPLHSQSTTGDTLPHLTKPDLWMFLPLEAPILLFPLLPPHERKPTRSRHP